MLQMHTTMRFFMPVQGSYTAGYICTFGRQDTMLVALESWAGTAACSY